VRSLEPAHVAAQIEALLEALRVVRVDVVGAGWGALVARALAGRPSRLVRRMVAIAGEDTSSGEAERALRRSAASTDPEALRARLLAALPRDLPGPLHAALAAELARAPARSLALLYRSAGPGVTPFGVGSPARVDLDASEARDPDRVWSELSRPTA
jgi:pimeloyl-ACP methyl ester carboxylesterase